MSTTDSLEYRASDAADAESPLVVALAGNPNCGKTTLFNGLTGLRQKVANYPGVTVEKKTGRCWIPDPAPIAVPDGKLRFETREKGQWIEVIDLPGTYSLISRSPDEQVAMEVLRGLRKDTPAPDVVICVIDASNLQRNLYLLSQLIELGRPMVVALNMTDVAERRGIKVDAEALAKELGVPVVPVVGHKKRGLAELKDAVRKAAIARMPEWPVPAALQAELAAVAGELAKLGAIHADLQRPEKPAGRVLQLPAPTPRDQHLATAERLLIGDHAQDIAPLTQDARVTALLNASFARLKGLGVDPMQADIEAHYRWIDEVAGRVVKTDEAAPATPAADGTLSYSGATTVKRTLTDRVDAYMIDRFWGLLIFAAIMLGLFISIFWLASPIMDAVKVGVEGLGDWLTAGWGDGALKSLVKDGIFAGVGGVVVFVPQIAILFTFLAILEDSGYLARAAFLMDRLLGKVGLSGKAFIPLLSSFACAIPGIMATRTIENRRDRLATIFIAPFMSCSARLPVYTLLIATFFASWSKFAQGGIMFACYALGVIAAVATAWCFKRTLLKGPPQAFILELPSYKAPQISQVVRVVFSNTSKFLTKAGTVIFCLSVILWAMNYYPRLPEQRVEEVKAATLAPQVDYDRRQKEHEAVEQPKVDAENARRQQAEAAAGKKLPWCVPVAVQPLPGNPNVTDEEVEKAVAAAQSEYSIAGRIGHFMEPAIRPLGYNWKMGVGLVSAFAAREVFVSSLGIVYSVGEVEDDRTALQEQMLADVRPDGTKAWTPVVGVSLLVWFVLAMQCMSTLAIVRRETGGWTWPIFMIVYMNGLAYIGALITYQVGSRLFT